MNESGEECASRGIATGLMTKWTVQWERERNKKMKVAAKSSKWRAGFCGGKASRRSHICTLSLPPGWAGEPTLQLGTQTKCKKNNKKKNEEKNFSQILEIFAAGCREGEERLTWQQSADLSFPLELPSRHRRKSFVRVINPQWSEGRETARAIFGSAAKIQMTWPIGMFTAAVRGRKSFLLFVWNVPRWFWLIN